MEGAEWIPKPALAPSLPTPTTTAVAVAAVAVVAAVAAAEVEWRSANRRPKTAVSDWVNNCKASTALMASARAVYMHPSIRSYEMRAEWDSSMDSFIRMRDLHFQ